MSGTEYSLQNITKQPIRQTSALANTKELPPWANELVLSVGSSWEQVNFPARRLASFEVIGPTEPGIVRTLIGAFFPQRARRDTREGKETNFIINTSNDKLLSVKRAFLRAKREMRGLQMHLLP